MVLKTLLFMSLLHLGEYFDRSILSDSKLQPAYLELTNNLPVDGELVVCQRQKSCGDGNVWEIPSNAKRILATIAASSAISRRIEIYG